MKIVLDFDDFSPKNSNIGLIEDLKDHFEGFKINLFTVAYDIQWGERTPITDEKWAPFGNAVRQSLDWMEICIHGLTHVPSEFKNIPYKEAKHRVMVAEKMFINQRIDYAKIFKAPNWDLSPGARKALKNLNFHAMDDGYYNWNLKDPFPQELVDLAKKAGKEPTIIAHGHIQNVMGNGLEEVFPKLMALPTKEITEWMFLSEWLKVDKVDTQAIWDQEEALKKGKVK